LRVMDRAKPQLRVVPSKDTGLLHSSDDELMILAQAGRRDAFAVLVERHAGRVFAVCFRYVSDQQLALELAQDTWAQAFEQRDHYAARGQFVVWLITAARNLCRNHLRHRAIVRRHCQQETGAPQTATINMPIEELLVAEERRQMRRAVAKLPLPLREALFMRYEHELRYEEMSQVLCVGEVTLRSRVHHALKLLRRWLEASS
jgi:RNA polymerase sigma factor (sigma-70 family)